MEEAEMLRDIIETGQDPDNVENIGDKVSAIRKKYREREMKRTASMGSYFDKNQDACTPLKPKNCVANQRKRLQDSPDSKLTSAVASIDLLSMLEEYLEEHDYFKEKLLSLLDADYASEKLQLIEDIKIAEDKLLQYKDCYAPILSEIITLETAATNEGEIEALLEEMELQHAEKEKEYKAEVDELLAEIESLKKEASSDTIIDLLLMLKKRVMLTELSNQNILSIIGDL